jgi:ribulose-phosphate 3-epimerase
MLTVAASLWSTPRERIDAEAARLAEAGLRRWHWDVSDGVFAAAGGFDVEAAGRVGRATGLPGEAHLMVSDPLASVDAWAEVCDTVIVHAEARGWQEAVDRVRHRGARPGVAISPDTPVSALGDLPDDVAVLVMSIVPGQAGARFLSTTLERLASLAGRPRLGVDGGVTLDLARECGAHGATWVVSGSSLCGSDDPGAWLRAASRDAAHRV